MSPTAGEASRKLPHGDENAICPEWGVMPEIPDGFAIPTAGDRCAPAIALALPWASPETASVARPRGRSPANRGAS
ncbi:hypothetical protein CO2235_170185 [Cupriavidus oxalaticus]|uniref:Uncharacterized protein n=1 Tax=Cupriavidus oxalaticus TaxID=96344 RepID=A0A375G2T7_9BURK|nr:hypothetical protein CO2235_170185 [Cupriavidus oxalaticus]